MPRPSLSLLAVIAVFILVAAAVLSGCSSPAQPRVSASPGLAAPVEPAPADLSDPARAVASYLAWTAYAYRLAASDVATHTMSPEESVRVDSYVQLNRERGRRIDQRLLNFAARPASIDGTRAVIGATEEWEYRYLSPDGLRAISTTHAASYDTTYTLIMIRPDTWVVDSVEAEPLTTVE